MSLVVSAPGLELALKAWLWPLDKLPLLSSATPAGSKVSSTSHDLSSLQLAVNG